MLETSHDMRACGQCISRQAISKKGEIIWRELKSMVLHTMDLTHNVEIIEFKLKPMSSNDWQNSF